MPTFLHSRDYAEPPRPLKLGRAQTLIFMHGHFILVRHVRRQPIASHGRRPFTRSVMQHGWNRHRLSFFNKNIRSPISYLNSLSPIHIPHCNVSFSFFLAVSHYFSASQMPPSPFIFWPGSCHLALLSHLPFLPISVLLLNHTLSTFRIPFPAIFISFLSSTCAHETTSYSSSASHISSQSSNIFCHGEKLIYCLQHLLSTARSHDFPSS